MFKVKQDSQGVDILLTSQGVSFTLAMKNFCGGGGWSEGSSM